MRVLACAIVVAACSSAPPPARAPVAHEPETLAFHRREGAIDNFMFRHGATAAHVAVTSGASPRVLVAFPAGNSGAALWFESGQAADFIATPPREAGSGGFHGVAFQLTASQPLTVREAALGSVRFLRDYQTLRALPAAVTATVEPGPPVTLRRTLLDGARVELVLDGAVRGDDGAIELPAGVAISVTATTDEPPLTPIERGDLLDVGGDLDALAFLAYREKLLAGSWRYLTYFGRDTLLTLRLVMAHARPELVEAGLSAVIDRLDPTGDVAHEEDIGDFAAWEHAASIKLDYKMIDDDLLLAPVLASYAETPAGHARLAELLARRTPSGRSYADAIAANAEFVLREARAYAAVPSPQNLVHLHAGVPVGEWRDSETGLGGGRIPYDVNAVLMPAALAAIATLSRDPAVAAEAARLASAWSHAADAFRIEIPLDVARQRVAEYSASLGLDASSASDAIAAIDAIDAPVVIRALALDDGGTAIPVMHSDDSFMLGFGTPSAAMLDEIAGRILRPFPAGLRTPVGIVVANPVFAPPELQRVFSRTAYHGTVIWSWQQAMLAEGLDRQLARGDLPARTHASLVAAKRALWAAIRGAPGMANSELWSWAFDRGSWRVAPFQATGVVEESDAVQLWSTVMLAIAPG